MSSSKDYSDAILFNDMNRLDVDNPSGSDSPPPYSSSWRHAKVPQSRTQAVDDPGRRLSRRTNGETSALREPYHPAIYDPCATGHDTRPNPLAVAGLAVVCAPGCLAYLVLRERRCRRCGVVVVPRGTVRRRRTSQEWSDAYVEGLPPHRHDVYMTAPAHDNYSPRSSADSYEPLRQPRGEFDAVYPSPWYPPPELRQRRKGTRRGTSSTVSSWPAAYTDGLLPQQSRAQRMRQKRSFRPSPNTPGYTDFSRDIVIPADMIDENVPSPGVLENSDSLARDMAYRDACGFRAGYPAAAYA